METLTTNHETKETKETQETTETPETGTPTVPPKKLKMPKYKVNEKVTLQKLDYLHKHPTLFSVLLWDQGGCEIKIYEVKQDTYIFFHGAHILELHHDYLDDPIACKVPYFIYDHKKVY